MEETRNEYGERVVRVENADEFWEVFEKGEEGILIDAPDGTAERLGFTDIAPDAA